MAGRQTYESGPDAAQQIESEKFFPDWRLLLREQSFDQFALSADSEILKGFEPIAQRHFRVAVEPVAQGYEVICRNLPQSYAICQMVHQLLRQVLASDFRHY